MLPSQFTRPKSSRSHMYRRTRRKRWPVVLMLLLILCGTVMAYRWKSGGSVQPANAGTSTAINDATPANDTKTVTPVTTPDVKRNVTPVPKPEVKAPVVPAAPKQDTQPKISMGGSNNTAASTPPTAPPANPASSTPAPPLRQPTAPPPAAPANQPKAGTAPNQPAANLPASGNAAVGANQRVSQRMAAGIELIKQNKPVEARQALSAALFSPGVTPAEAEQIRNELTKVNQRLLFSPEVVANDPFVATHSIESGDSLAKLPKKLGLNVDWRFLQRINGISSPERIQKGQRLKVATGPFHAVVHKKDFRMDLFMGGASGSAGDTGGRVFVRSFTVGLGEHDATPEGVFIVKPNSKLVDPEWVNPRTGERFLSKDPKNPIGRFWVGLVGESDNIRGLEGYGVHGTIDPDSIGAMKSMGCVRLGDDDIALVYELLMDGVSTVEIHGDDYP